MDLANNPSNTKGSNRLIHEKSPYLLQHAHNPVDWYPWGEEAFTKARREDKPIFLSIGYSTCHWCHVMEHESFEDSEVAKLMNDTFVSIKVDREERPDLDSIYMSVCQMMTGRGGWPLTIIMTPDKKPFFAGTYFPKQSRLGLASMMEWIPRIQEIWKKDRDKVEKSAEQITLALQTSATESPGDQMKPNTLRIAYEQLAERFDKQQGGFGAAPKFPTPHNLLFLLRYWKRTQEAPALHMVEKTLDAMRQGGMCDQIGFGFHRYSTDAHWLVPHFEKMLYDQALLAMAYTEAYQATKNTAYRKTAEEIFTYVLRDMTSPEGGFYSAEDADSEGVEGKFYLWTVKGIRSLLTKEEADLFIHVYNLEAQGNFSEETSGSPSGANIPYLQKSVAEIASVLNLSAVALENRLDTIQVKLFSAREKRPHPGKDDKILADWNGLMIVALAKASQAFQEPTYAEKAEHAAQFLLTKMKNQSGRLLHRYRTGEAAVNAFCDDYAFLIWGLIELYEATFKTDYLKTAIQLNQDLLTHFWDEKRGGFYFTAEDAEHLFIRKKESYDGAVPSANSVALLNLIRLARFTGNTDLEAKADQLIQAFSHNANQIPSAHTLFLSAADFGIGPAYEVVICGKPGNEDARKMLAALQSTFLPNKVVLFRESDQATPAITQLAPFTQTQTARGGKATAYVCQNYTCAAPTTDPEVMLQQLNTR